MGLGFRISAGEDTQAHGYVHHQRVKNLDRTGITNNLFAKGV